MAKVKKSHLSNYSRADLEKEYNRLLTENVRLKKELSDVLSLPIGYNEEE